MSRCEFVAYSSLRGADAGSTASSSPSSPSGTPAFSSARRRATTSGSESTQRSAVAPVSSMIERPCGWLAVSRRRKATAVPEPRGVSGAPVVAHDTESPLTVTARFEKLEKLERSPDDDPPLSSADPHDQLPGDASAGLSLIHI